MNEPLSAPENNQTCDPERQAHAAELLHQATDVELGRTLARPSSPDVAPTAAFELADDGTAPARASKPQAAAGDAIGQPAASCERFQILRLLGKGGLGMVSVALDAELHREVALKEILPEQADDPRSRARFLVEGELTGRLEHPGIVPVYSLGTGSGGRPYYVMRLVRGQTLKVAIEQFHAADRQAARGPGARELEFRKLLARFLDVCHVVAYAHSRGVLHRDLKPSNILLGPFGETLVVDWGLAKVIGRREPEPGAAETTLRPSSGSGSVETLPGTAVGTPAFMSPEQAEGHVDELEPASDIYSLGATLYCLLTGKPPLEGSDVIEVLRKARRGDFRPPRQISRGIPPALEAVCLKAMSLRPEDRYASADALAEDIEHWLADEPVAACREPWTARAARWARRHKPVVAGAAALLAAAVAALAIGAAILGREQQRTAEQRDLAIANALQADERAESLERQLYINRVNLAYREALANNVALAEHLLEGCPESRRGWEWAYCRRLCHLESLSITLEAGGHGYAYDLAFNPDGTTIASANHDGTISLWDVATGREVRTIGSRGPPVLALAFSPDSRAIATGGSGVVKIWEARTGHELRSLRGPVCWTLAVRFSPDGRRLAAGSSTLIEARNLPEVKVWEVATGRELGSFQARRWGQLDLAFSPDGQQVATVNEWETALNFHDASTGREIRTVEVGAGGGNSGVAYAPDGRQIALACRDGSVLLWDAVANVLLRSFRGHTSFARSVDFSPDGLLAASASFDGAVKLWEVATGREIANYRGHTGEVGRVCFSSDGTRLASLGYLAIKLWEVGAEQDVLSLRGNQGWAFRVAVSPNGQRLITAGFNIVRVRDAGTGQTLKVIGLSGGGVQGLALSPDGRQVATSGEFAQDFHLWETGSGRHVATFKGHTGRLRGLAFSPDGNQIASASEDRTVRLWEAATGRELRALRGHTRGVFGVAFDPQGRQLASISWDGRVRLWDASTGNEVQSFVAGKRYPSASFGDAVAFSLNGRRLAAVAQQGQVIFWNVQSGHEEMRLAGHTREVNGVAFSPDGRRLASAGDDNTIKLWDVTTGEEVFTLRGHSNGVLSVAFSPDSLRLASASKDGTVKVWEAVPPTAEVLRQRRAVAEADPDVLTSKNNLSWAVVRQANRPREDYERALREAEAVCRLGPEVAFYLNTLGVAQYRVGRYQQAVKTLAQSDRLNSAAYRGSIPADLAFLAMAHHRLGHQEEAQAFLGRLREVMKTPRWRGDAESKAFLQETETLMQRKQK